MWLSFHITFLAKWIRRRLRYRNLNVLIIHTYKIYVTTGILWVVILILSQ